MNMNKRDPIEKYYPPVRVLNCLKRAGLHTVGDVINARNGALYSACPTIEDCEAVSAFARKLAVTYARRKGLCVCVRRFTIRDAWVHVLSERA